MSYADGFLRIVVWQPSSGYVIDFTPRDYKRAVTLTQGREYFDAGDNSQYAIATDRLLELIQVDESHAATLQRMKAIGCPVKLCAIGLSRHILWLDETAFNHLPNRAEPKDFAADSLRFRNNNYYAPIWDTRDLLEPLDFAGLTVQASGADYYLVGEDGLYAPVKWRIEGATVPPTINELGQLVTDGTLYVDFELPIGGATLGMTTAGGSINVDHVSTTFLAWDEGELDTVGLDLATVVPAHTWSMRVMVGHLPGLTMTVTRPSLNIIAAGRYEGAERTGLIPPTCAPAVFGSGFLPPWLSYFNPPNNAYVWRASSVNRMYRVPLDSAGVWVDIGPFGNFSNLIGSDDELGYLFGYSQIGGSPNVIYRIRRIDIDKTTGYTTGNSTPITISQGGDSSIGIMDYYIDNINQEIVIIRRQGSFFRYIDRYDYDGNFIINVYTFNEIATPHILGVDETYIYWADQTDNQRYRINRDGTGLLLMANNAISWLPFSVNKRMDTEEGYSFGSNSGSPRRIYRADLQLDGQTIIKTLLGTNYYGFELERTEKKVYHFDESTAGNEAIFRMNYDGTNVEQISITRAASNVITGPDVASAATNGMVLMTLG